MVMFYRVAKYFLMNLKNENIFLGQRFEKLRYGIYILEYSADQWRQDLFTYSPKKSPCGSLLCHPCQDDPANQNIGNDILY